MQVTSINERVEKIKNNDHEINILVEEYKPFIASCTEKAVGRYVRFGEDDELSIALMAFVEAIKSYDSSKGNFLSLAQNVIKRRLIDYFRKERKHANVVPLYYSDDDTEDEKDFGIEESIEKHSIAEISEYRRLELIEFKKELLCWDISFLDLVESSPKQNNTRKIYNDIIRFITSKPDLTQQILHKKYLPIAEIEKNLKIPRKKIERARKYIIAALIIITGDYHYIRDYVEWG